MTRRVDLLGLGRRGVMAGGAALLGAGTAGCRAPAAAPTLAPGGEPLLGPTVWLDGALRRLHETDLEYAVGPTDGLSNHGPMAAEALEALGRAERIDPFLDHYATRLRPLKSQPAFLASERSARLGDATHATAWVRAMEAELLGDGAGGPASVEARFGELAAELLPGFVAAAVHGPLRAAHAWRGYRRQPSVVRARELAFGLGYWASRYQTLPGTPGARPHSGAGVTATLLRVPIVPRSRRALGLIFDQLRVLGSEPGFAAALEGLDVGAGRPEALISELSALGARLYLRAESGRFAYMHALTGAVALRRLAPALPAKRVVEAVGYGVQAVAGLLAVNGAPTGWHEPWPDLPAVDPRALRRAAANSYDDHTIKFVEAALCEYELSPQPEFVAAAAHRIADTEAC